MDNSTEFSNTATLLSSEIATDPMPLLVARRPSSKRA